MKAAHTRHTRKSHIKCVLLSCTKNSIIIKFNTYINILYTIIIITAAHASCCSCSTSIPAYYYYFCNRHIKRTAEKCIVFVVLSVKSFYSLVVACNHTNFFTCSLTAAYALLQLLEVNKKQQLSPII